MVIGILTLLTYTVEENLWPEVLVFVLFARGFVDLLCWFWVNFDAPVDEGAHLQAFTPHSSSYKLAAGPNVNKDLQDEITGYMSRGLQKSSEVSRAQCPRAPHLPIFYSSQRITFVHSFPLPHPAAPPPATGGLGQ